VYTRGQVEGFGGDIKLVNDLGRNEQMEDEENDVEDEVAGVEGQEEENVVQGLVGEEVIVFFVLTPSTPLTSRHRQPGCRRTP